MEHANHLRGDATLTDPLRSYGALYHPWLIGREENKPDELRRTPPDGAISGLFAQRALTRGAWVAPANAALPGVLALTPAVPVEQALALQCARVNLLQQTPRGFLVANADTLSGGRAFTEDECTQVDDYRAISVRRLLSLLRRLALRQGAVYVFEPNDPAFRRLVQRSFEAVLERLLRRGAFAGRTASSAYQVVIDGALNSPQSLAAGRFIVELRVAPAQPLKFLTVRLVQTNDQLQVNEPIA